MAQHILFKAQGFSGDSHRNRAYNINDQIHSHTDGLSDARRQSRALDAHSRKGANAEDQQRIQNNIADTACHEAYHGHLHPSYCLKDFLKAQAKGNHHREGKNDAGIPQRIVDNPCILRIQPQEARHHQQTDDHQNQALNRIDEKADRSRPIRLLLSLCPQIEGNGGVDADAKADGNRIDQILNRIDQGQGRHGLLADAGYKIAVHDIVQGIDQHGKHHGQGHRKHQTQNRFLFHESIVHFVSPLIFPHKNTTQI